MQFIIQRNRLINSVQHVMRAVSSRTTIPILTGIKIVADSNGITFTGSDSDISIESFIPVEEDGDQLIEMKQTGSIVLNARFFGDIVRKLPMDTVEIFAEDTQHVLIKSGKAEFNLNGFDPSEYPLLPQISEEDVFSIPGDLLKMMIKQTVFAVSTSEIRPILTGVNWQIEDGNLICVATDSHRLAKKSSPIDVPGDVSYQTVIPGKSLLELSKILDDSDHPVNIVITENQILFKTKNIHFFTRRLEGNYPDTSRLIPSDYKTNITLDGKVFNDAIERASLLAREERNNVVKLASQGENMLEISSNTPEIGNVSEEIPIESLQGEELTISFSAKYMMEALRAIDGTDITISFTGAMRPFIIRSEEDPSILQLILPVRTA
ncbi:MAG TPA: DNA polymerase III subunit beta [Bacillus bacterium]|uniref:Beta sliding clamp n=1 Tax=Siminovitchia fordii TaxID=254759 RepID=A0ABQ4K881_9BACI|nr:DNA polymerase III subunit beta [Siminovitchia fordii]GIN21942.1 DNA polymerase III subunit beta [Siminovitchia fordii]HBZ11052.1 DNA polymerase III subunit beta [Bacillus sp. (in: firmicutes)]